MIILFLFLVIITMQKLKLWHKYIESGNDIMTDLPPSTHHHPDGFWGLLAAGRLLPGRVAGFAPAAPEPFPSVED